MRERRALGGREDLLHRCHCCGFIAALRRLRRALEEFVIEGVTTTIPLHQALLDVPDFQKGDYTIKWLEEWLA